MNGSWRKSWRWLVLSFGLSVAIGVSLNVDSTICFGAGEASPAAASEKLLTLSWTKDMLTIHGDHLPGKRVQIWYLEAYCRPGSTDRVWHDTVIGHQSHLVAETSDRRHLQLRCELRDGVQVDHQITAHGDFIDFQLEAHNPTQTTSQAHWAQPCIRVADFTGVEQKQNGEAYLPKCFILLNGALTRLPTQPWATTARYTPGQVYCPAHVSRNDVNPRPVSELVPTEGLIGCFSADESMILATTWEPYQELFQGVICCIHADFRIGGLEPGARKKIRGRLYLVAADVPALLRRYRADFPEHRTNTVTVQPAPTAPKPANKP